MPKRNCVWADDSFGDSQQLIKLDVLGAGGGSFNVGFDPMLQLVENGRFSSHQVCVNPKQIIVPAGLGRRLSGGGVDMRSRFPHGLSPRQAPARKYNHTRLKMACGISPPDYDTFEAIPSLTEGPESFRQSHVNGKVSEAKTLRLRLFVVTGDL